MVTKAWRSGGAWQTQKIAQAIVDNGGKVTLIAPLGQPEEREPHHANLRRIVLQREFVDGAGNFFSRKIASLSRIIGSCVATLGERLRTRTFFVTIPEPLPFIIPVLALLRLSGARILFLVHDAEPHAWKLAPNIRWVERWAHGLTYRFATTLVVLTAPVRNELVEKFGIAEEHIVVIPHGPFTIDPVPPLPGTGKFLLFGTLRRNKCVLETIQGVILARKSDPGVSLVLAGEPHGYELDYWQECQAAIAQDPSGFEVKTGYVADEDLPALIATADAFVTAYQDFKSASGVAMVAVLSGRPALATDAGSLEELFALGMSGERIDVPVTAEAIAAAIGRFRSVPAAQWRERAAQATAVVSASISWDRIARDYLSLVRNGKLPA
jgi:glycosyltransferase involved in cell wall biosynthesis